MATVGEGGREPGLTRQESVNSAARPLELCVYLADDMPVPLVVENGAGVTAGELCHYLQEAHGLPTLANDVFALWLISSQLELQLKPRHQPYRLCRQWPDLLYRFTDCPLSHIHDDVPALIYRRNVFFPKSREAEVTNTEMLGLLYREAKGNVLAERYPCDPAVLTQLGVLTCAIELGPHDPAQHTAARIKTSLSEYLPPHMCKSGGGSGGGLLSGLLSRGTAGGGSRPPAREIVLLQGYENLCREQGAEACTQRTPLFTQYLHICQQLPYYGCAFFSGEVERPAGGGMLRLVGAGRKPVLVAISLEGIYIIDVKEKHVLLGLRHTELSWDVTGPDEEHPDDAHALWLEFDGTEDGAAVNRLLKVYSKQAELMNGMIEHCMELSHTTTPATPLNSVAPVTPVTSSDPEEPAVITGPSSEGGAPNAASTEAGARGRGRRGKLQRQESVLDSRVEQLSTISYVDDGKELRRVKPRRAASFFSRQPSVSGKAYATVAATDTTGDGAP